MPSSEIALFPGLELGLASMALALRDVLELLSLVTVLLGLVVTLRQGWLSWRRRLRGSAGFRGVRITFGSWLAMALEFQLGADIVATSTSPTGAHLVQLSVVAVIRTLLNVFLARDLDSEQAHQPRQEQARP
ncbi:MAG: DUF1622 domain-containing protein [Cyanobium sp.]